MAAEPPNDWHELVDLSNSADVPYIEHVFSMSERHKINWFCHLGEIKGVPQLIELKPGIRPLHQQQYLAGPQRCELIEEHVHKMLATEVLEPAQSDWTSPIVIAREK